MRNPGTSSWAAAAAAGGSRVGLKRGPWTAEEDELLARCVRREGEGRWRTLPKRAGLQRCGKSCRLRWMNYLRPDVKRGRIAPDEEDLILRLHRLLGNRWSLIAGRIPGRTDNEIKNYWNTHLSKKLISQGIDPRTHKPLDVNQLNPNPQSPPPNPNPNPDSPCMMHTGGGGVLMLPDDNTNYFDSAGGCDRWWGNEEIKSNEGRRVGGCTGGDDDDIFSSFLNSLINEDTSLQQEDQHNNISNNNNCDQLGATLASTPVFNRENWWEASLSSPAALEHDVTGKFADHVSEQF